jgi:hypothetical protein
VHDAVKCAGGGANNGRTSQSSDERRPQSSDPRASDGSGPGSGTAAANLAITPWWPSLGDRKIRGPHTIKQGEIVNRIPVVSSTIAAVGYDDASGTLEIEFTNGRIYHYFDTPQHVYETTVSGTVSAGQYFNDNIRGVYRYARV